MGCLAVNRVFLKHASEGNLTVMLGVWINGVDKDQDEINDLMTALEEYPHANLSGIAVGNEVAFRGSMSISDIVEAVLTVREQVKTKTATLKNTSLVFRCVIWLL